MTTVDGKPVTVKVGGSRATVQGHGVRLPLLTITTDGGVPVLDKDNYIPAAYAIHVQGEAPITGTLRLKGRGNYTWLQPKKPYRLNFDQAIAPLGMKAKQKNWALLANYDDKQKICYATGLQLGYLMSENLGWTPEYRLVEVVLNGDYIGLYMLADLVRLEKGRVPGDAVKGATGDALTGTWLAEISRRYIQEGDPGFTTTHDVMISYDDPGVALDGAGNVAVQAAYFRDKVQAFEDALYGADWLDATKGYKRFVHLGSFVDWWLINEFSANRDSNFESSVKLWKERDSLGGRIHMGPLWDLSISFGNPIPQPYNPQGWYVIPGAVWIQRMLEDPEFRALVRERWTVLKGHIPALFAFQADLMQRQATAMVRDEQRWNLPHVVPADAISTTQRWTNTRIAWLDKNLPQN